jgi:hypothetical protein
VTGNRLKPTNPHAHDIIKDLEAHRLNKGISIAKFCSYAGRNVSWWTITKNTGKGSFLFNLDVAASVFGLRIALVPIEKGKQIN